MLNVAFTCVLWSARLSILFSIIRLIPFLMRLRMYATMAAVLFGCMWASLIILKIAICETHPEWKQTQGVQCVLGPAVAGVELATDIIADVILVALPIRLLWNLKLSPSRRALLTGIFSASMFTTVVSIVHGVFVFSPNRNAEGIWAHVLASTAMIVANLAVLVIWFMHLVGYREESQISPDRTSGMEGTDQTLPKDISTLRFNHDTGPIVLQPLDRKGIHLNTLNSFASRSEGSLATMTFATNTSRDVASKVDRSAYLEPVNRSR
uniref:PKS_ER domain-containing protein n=1 Tax=Ganoderma boninense TaxID=34458 RepID=A0A5K1K1R0_9APHY|nr:PKS_ER domain-containing protein [Ganoderma boninense]